MNYRIENKILESSYNNKKITLDYRWAADGKAKPVILFIHGFKGFKDWGYFNMMADYFANLGFVSTKLNLSHNGTSPDSPTEFVDLEAFANNNFTIELDDIGVVIDYFFSELKNEEFNLDQFYLTGHSRGGGLAILKGYEDERVKKVVALAPIHNLKKRWSDEVLGIWKEKGVMEIENSRTGQIMLLYYQLVENTLENYKRLDIPKTVKNYQKPLFVAHGTSDATLPVEYAHEIKSWNHMVHLKIVEEADHTFGGKHPYHENKLPNHLAIVLESVVEFLNSK